MKQKLKRFMAGFMAMLTLVGTLFANGTTAFAASPQANIAFWYASTKNSGEVSELKAGYNHGKILYSILDGNSAYCMNFGLKADGGQLMNSYDDASTSMSAQQRKLLSYCLYYGFNSTQKAAPSNSQCDEYIATQAMVWVIVADIFGTGSGDSAARKLCNTAPSPDSSYSYYERLRDNISSSYNATLPSFASRRTSEAPTYELKWNEGSQRFETTLSDSNGVLSDFDFGISGYSVDKNELLVCRRGKEPAKGTLDLSGGFIDMHETGEEGVAREVLEETGLQVEEAVYQFSLPNTYLYSGFLVHTLDLFFLCKVKDTSRIKAMDDVAESFWLPLDEVNPEEFGLDSVREGVRRFLKEHKL